MNAELRDARLCRTLPGIGLGSTSERLAALEAQQPWVCRELEELNKGLGAVSSKLERASYWLLAAALGALGTLLLQLFLTLKR